MPIAHCGVQSALERISQRHCRERTPRGAGRGEGIAARALPRAAARHSHRAQGQYLDARSAHHGGLENFARLRAGSRCHGDAETAARGRRAAGENEHARIRVRHHQRKPALRRHMQSVGPGANLRGIERGFGGGDRGGNVLRFGGHRYRWIDTCAGGAVRHCGAEADVWPRQPVRHRAAGAQFRSCGPAGAERRGRGAAAKRYCGTRPARCRKRQAAARGFRKSEPPPAQTVAAGAAAGIFLGATRSGSTAARGSGGGGYGKTRRDGRGRESPECGGHCRAVEYYCACRGARIPPGRGIFSRARGGIWCGCARPSAARR